MTQQLFNKRNIPGLLALLLLLSACSKLSLQKDYDRDPKPLDPKLYKTTLQFIKDRANGAVPQDTIFRRMLAAAEYAEIDLAEYEKTGKTFILLHNDAIYRTAKAKKKVNGVEIEFDSVQNDCFFGANFVNGKPAMQWSDYPKDFVKTYLQFLIVEGILDHYTIKTPSKNVVSGTLAPGGSLSTLPAGITRHANWPFVANNESTIRLKVLNSSPSNTSDYPIVINDVRNVRTSSLQADNGSVHVIDRFLPPGWFQ